MPVLPYTNRVEPAEDTAICRYLDLRKFRDLMASEELYFRRADLFTDKSEGLPPEEYATRVLGLNPLPENAEPLQPAALSFAHTLNGLEISLRLLVAGVECNGLL